MRPIQAGRTDLLEGLRQREVGEREGAGGILEDRAQHVPGWPLETWARPHSLAHSNP
jgi:hypothetical protein